MKTAFVIYLLMKLDSIASLARVIVGAIVVSIVFVVLGVLFSEEEARCELNSDKQKRYYKELARKLSAYPKKLIAALVFAVLFSVSIPDTRTALYMIGGAATMDVLKSEQAKDIGGKSLELVNKKLDAELGNEQ